MSRGGLRERLLVMARVGSEEAVNHLVGHVRVREAAFDTSPVAQMVVDVNNQLALANDRARNAFGLAPSDLGRPIQDLQISYRPTDLRSGIDRAYAERRPIVISDVEWPSGAGEPGYLDIHVVPLVDGGGTLLGAGIAFLDVTASRRLRRDLESSRRELETAHEEIETTNEELQSTIEELQSTVEELETTNEELQSTNEELETMNEELQSTNEELKTVNEDLRDRSNELDKVNIFLESILGSLRGGVAVLDGEFVIHAWNEQAEELWGLRADEVRGKNLLNLDIGLPVDLIRPPVRACLAGEVVFQEITLEAVNRRGRRIDCRFTCTPMKSSDGVYGVILMMEETKQCQSSDRDAGGESDGASDREIGRGGVS